MAEKDSATKKKKEKGSVKKVITTVIIVILALLMVGGFSYILSGISQKKAEKQNVFGTYDGEDIKIAYGNVFYNTLMNDEAFMSAASNDFNTIYSAYQTAYMNQLMFTAIDQMAKKAKIGYTQNVIDDYLLDSGLFNGEDGKFSEEVYNSYTADFIAQSDAYAKTIYPYSMVIADYQSLLTSPVEAMFVTEMSSKGRNFEYIILDFTSFPDDQAAAYGQENKDKFIELDLSMITVATEDDAKAVVAALDGGMSWTDAVAQYSLDSFKEQDGYIGSVVNPWNILNNLLNADDINKIYELKKDQYSQPIEGVSGWTVYKLESDTVFEPDFKKEQTLTLVKYYLQNQEPAVITDYIKGLSTEAFTAAQADFEKAAKTYSKYDVVALGPVGNNVGESSILYTLHDFDPYGFLAEAVDGNEEAAKAMYTSEAGTVIGPYEYEGGCVIVKVGEEQSDASLNTVLTYSAYSTAVPSLVVDDLATSIMYSDKLEDNFFTVMFNMLMSNMSASAEE